jgi:tRNA nucleotidyltransferase (CCA-adding enzyme)
VALVPARGHVRVPVMARSIDPSLIPKDVRFIAEKLGEAGFGAWVVGGCVRDLLMDRKVSDWDLATSAHPTDVQRIFHRTIPTGIKHGTISVMLHGERYELTTLRGEGAYSDGRRPDSVHFVGTIEEDLARRDFTLNAIAWDPLTSTLVDPWGGLPDLDAGILRAVRDPKERFSEDGLRALRAARFTATLELDLDPATEAAIPGALDTFAKVSPERVRDEWEKAMKAMRPSRAFAVMHRTGMLARTAPFMARLDDAAMKHALARLDLVPSVFPLRIAALIRDTDEPIERVEAWLRGMRFSNPDRERVLLLVRERAFAFSVGMPGPARRRALKRFTPDGLFALLDLASADAQARRATDDAAAITEAFERELDAGVALSTKDLVVTGNDLMKELGIPPSRELGNLLDALLELVLDDPALNERAILLERARALRGGAS